MHRRRGGARGQRRLGEGVDLRARERSQTEGVSSDVEAVGVGTDQRLIPEAGAVASEEIGAVKGDGDVVEVEEASRIARLADRDLEVVATEKIVVLDHGDEPAI